VYDHFLTDEECDLLIAQGYEQGLERSSVAGSSQNEQTKARTSYGTFLEASEITKKVDQRIAAWTQIPEEHGEPFYLLRYEEGQEYKPHYDYFDPNIPGMKRYLGPPGQRLATVLIYLGEPELGGETVFPVSKDKLAVFPTKGSAVLFFSQTPDQQLDRNSLHGSAPVIKGVKYCCTKWIRENPWVH
jgi:prolyl 4-hydroxylase